MVWTWTCNLTKLLELHIERDTMNPSKKQTRDREKKFYGSTSKGKR